MYTMVCTRLNIAHLIRVVSQFLSNPTKEQWATVKWIPKYLHGTSKICLCLVETSHEFVGYIDANMAGDVDLRKSTLEYFYYFCRRSSINQSYKKYICFTFHQ